MLPLGAIDGGAGPGGACLNNMINVVWVEAHHRAQCVARAGVAQCRGNSPMTDDLPPPPPAPGSSRRTGPTPGSPPPHCHPYPPLATPEPPSAEWAASSLPEVFWRISGTLHEQSATEAGGGGVGGTPMRPGQGKDLGCASPRRVEGTYSGACSVAAAQPARFFHRRQAGNSFCTGADIPLPFRRASWGTMRLQGGQAPSLHGRVSTEET